jgi:hypothetical protein
LLLATGPIRFGTIRTDIMTRFKTARRRLAIMSIALLSSVASVPAHAFEKVVTGVTFTLHCFGLMLTDPDEHVTVCKPAPIKSSLSSLSEMTGGPRLANPPVIDPPPPPECEIEQTNCGPICTYPDDAK